VAYFLRKHSKGMDVSISQEAKNFLMENNWKGNARELENVIARACIMSNYSVIKLTHLNEMKFDRESSPGSIKEMEMKLILDALKTCNGNKTRAASMLGKTTRTLRNKIKEYKDMGILPSGEEKQWVS